MLKKCCNCGKEYQAVQFISTNSSIFKNSLPICRNCIRDYIENNKVNGSTWNAVDKLCQMADVPFVPEKWQEIYNDKGANGFGPYCAIFRAEPYNKLDWKQYNDAYVQLQEEQRMEDAMPTLKEEKFKKQQELWRIKL